MSPISPANTTKTRPIIFLFITIAIVLWGFSFVWTNQLIEADIPVFTFIFFRMLMAGTLLLIFSLAAKKLQRVKGKDFLWLLLMAFLEPFIYFIGETFGLKATNSPTLSALIVATIPIFAMSSEIIFYKVKISWINILGVLVTIPGILLMVLNTGKLTADYWWGIALLFLAVFGSVGYSTVIKKLSANYNSYTLTTWQFILGAAFFFPFFLIYNDGYPLQMIFTREIIVPLGTLAVLCSCLAFVLYVNAIREIGITRSSIFTSLIPGVAAIGAYMYGIESFTWIQMGGILIVILGVVFTQWKKK